MKNKFLSLLALTILGSCTVFPDSPPARLYALELPAFSPVVNCPSSFALREVKIPGYLDRAEVVLSNESYKVSSSAQHLWASPLPKELTRLTARALQELLGGSVALPYPVRQYEKPEWIISMEVSRVHLGKDSFRMEITTTGHQVLKTESGAQANIRANLIPFITSSSTEVAQAGVANAAAETVAKALSDLFTLNFPKIALELGKTMCQGSNQSSAGGSSSR
jgi:uncharacterized lipoprotein YmbA